MDRFAITAAVNHLKIRLILKHNVPKVIEAVKKLVGDLTALGFKILPSKANFILPTHPSTSAAQLAQQLREHGHYCPLF